MRLRVARRGTARVRFPPGSRDQQAQQGRHRDAQRGRRCRERTRHDHRRSRAQHASAEPAEAREKVTMNDSDRFLQATASETSRPRAVNPQTGAEQSWQRASNYAAPLDSPHGLIKWQLRELVKGISLRPDLARMLLTGAAIEDNAKADEIIAAAHATAGIDAKANNGTAVHAALSRSFLGHEVPQEYLPHISAFVAELRRNGLEPVATEVQVLCVKLGVIGHTDWVVRTPDNRHLILDVKTGRLGDGRKFSIQCTAYAAAEHIDDGKNGWAPIPFEIDQTEAILAHVDPETGATSLYRVDLVLGLYGATLAERVRDWDKITVLSPYVPAHPAITALQPQRVANRGTVESEAVSAPFEPRGAQGVSASSSPVQVAKAPTGPATSEHPVFSSAHQQTFSSETALEQAHAAPPQTGLIEGTRQTIESEFDELMVAK